MQFSSGKLTTINGKLKMYFINELLSELSGYLKLRVSLSDYI